MTQVKAWIAFVYWPLSMSAWPPGTVHVGWTAATGATAPMSRDPPRIRANVRRASAPCRWGASFMSWGPLALNGDDGRCREEAACVDDPSQIAAAHRGDPLTSPPRIRGPLLDP